VHDVDPRDPSRSQKDLAREVAELRARLQEAEDTLDAIRNGDVDALIVRQGPDTQVYTLESADRPYRLLIEQMQEGALTVNTQGRILYCNTQFADLLGAARDDILGQDLAQFVCEEDRPNLAALQKLAIRETAGADLRLCGPDKIERPVHMSLALLSSDQGSQLCGIVTDLTTERRRAKELSDINDKLRDQIANREEAEAQLRQLQKMEALGQLTGGVAHDFNNLLTIILGRLRPTLKSATDPAVADRIADAITAAERGARLTQQLLTFARRQTLQSTVLDVGQLFAELESLLRHALGVDCELDIQAAADTWHCVCDRTQLESALLNLAINARDAMGAGGMLKLTSENFSVDAGEADYADLKPGRYLVIGVEDTGQGISSELLSRVIEPFFTTKAAGTGSGLGLSQVYGFVQQSGGGFRIDSKIGHGTRVRLFLPATDRPAETAANNSSAPAFESGLRVLVVEDENVVRAIALDLFREYGFTAVPASNAAAARDILANGGHFDLLFSDVVMPGSMNGIELARYVRAHYPHMSILLTSGYTAISGSQMSTPTEFAFIRKPYEVGVLEETVAKTLAGRPPRVARTSADSFSGKTRVLVVDDEPMVALMIADSVEEVGCVVVGPCPTLSEALEVAASDAFDVVLLDLKLGDVYSYPVAEILKRRRIPFAFVTGGLPSSLPSAYGDIPRLPKPYDPRDFAEVISAMKAAKSRGAETSAHHQ
jgi:PAS domain S-box-containing protein